MHFFKIPDPERNTFIWRSSEYDRAMDHIIVTGVRGLPIIHTGDNIPALICKGHSFEDGDILCIASTIYSKSKGYTRPLASITPG
jgi:F420-0:gamma-glutamyl ligase